jgi:DNA topoisomerase I
MPEAAAIPDEVLSAKQAGLRYAIPKGAGIQRQKSGSDWAYFDTHGRPVEDEKTLARIRSLVIPPAWESVWISPSANGHIQAVGRDAKGRKQYRYHPNYRAARDLVKFDRMLAFGQALPNIREAVDKDLGLQGMPKRKVLAAVVRLLETTFIRIGNEEYVEENGSFGLTTLRNKHVQVLGSVLKFKFRGKSGQNHDIELKDRRLAKIVGRCREIPGSSLFEYIDEDGQPHALESGDVNDYLREISGGEFTAKDFRTWGGTCLAANYLLCQLENSDASESIPAKHLKSVLVDVVKDVACKLGNKPATCKKYYIHPAILESFSAGTLKEAAEKYRDARNSTEYEKLVLGLLEPMKKQAEAA